MTDYWPNEKEQVTVIRYRVVFEEAVISRDEFERANQKIRELEENVYFWLKKLILSIGVGALMIRSST